MQGLIMNAFYSASRFGCMFMVVAALLSCAEKGATEVAPLEVNKVVSEKTKKPGAAIKLLSNPVIFIAKNQRIFTHVVLDIKEPSGELMIELSASQGLSLEDTNTNQRVKFDAVGSLTIPVILSAAENGRYHLNIHARLNSADASLARNLAVIVQVGPLAQSAAKLKISAGDNLIILPAQETISSK